MAQDGAALGAMWGEQAARQLLRDAGFRLLDVTQVPGDFQNSYFIATTGE